MMNRNLVHALMKQTGMMRGAALAIAGLIAFTLILLAVMGQDLSFSLGDYLSLAWRAKP